MANIKSAIKRIKITKRQSEENLAHRTKAKTYVKKANTAIQAKDTDTAAASVKQAAKVLDTVARKGVIHKNKAARLKSRLAKKLNAIGTTPAEKKEAPPKKVAPAKKAPAKKASTTKKTTTKKATAKA